jgi:hypothetical protein
MIQQEKGKLPEEVGGSTAVQVCDLPYVDLFKIIASRSDESRLPPNEMPVEDLDSDLERPEEGQEDAYNPDPLVIAALKEKLGWVSSAHQMII